MKLSHLILLTSFALVPALRAAEPASSTPATTEERLQRIEAQLARLEREIQQKPSAQDFAPALKQLGELTRQLGADGKTPLVVVKPAGKEQKLSLGGFVQMQAEAGDAPDSRYTGINNRLLVRRARLTFKGSFAENFDFTLQSDFGNNSISANTAYRVQTTDAFITWNKYEAATVQVGQFKTPFGYEQLLTDTKTLTIERSLPNDQLVVNRQIGAGLSGTFLGKRLSYSTGVFNGNGTNVGNNDNDQFMYVARVSGVAWSKGDNRLSLGANGYWSRDTGAFTGWRTGSGADAQLTFGRFDVAAEYLHVIQNRAVGSDVTGEGGSLLVGAFLLPLKLQAVARYEYFDSDTRTDGTSNAAWLAGLNYFIKGDDLKLSVNYLLGDPAGPLSNQGRILARLQLVF